jgi:uncharacterized membrane protein
VTTTPAEPVVATRTGVRAQLEDVAARIEKLSAVDGAARAARDLVRQALPPGIADMLRGEQLGHPLHPALVAVPIGSWLSASVLDLTGGAAGAARRLVGLGVLSALPSAAAGAADWVSVDPDSDPATFRVGAVHAALNDLALGLYVASWLARGRDRRARGAVLALVGSGVLAASGWLGGHLVYRRGMGVASG